MTVMALGGGAYMILKIDKNRKCVLHQAEYALCLSLGGAALSAILRPHAHQPTLLTAHARHWSHPAIARLRLSRPARPHHTRAPLQL